MSMMGMFREIPADLLEQIKDDPSLVESILKEESDSGPLLDIGKAWQGLHFLLTGNAERVTPGVGQAVLGGTEIGPDWLGYGPARFLNSQEVAAVSKALSALTADVLRSRFDPKALLAASIYPQVWHEKYEKGQSDNADWLINAFQEVSRFYDAAAERGSAILLYLE